MHVNMFLLLLPQHAHVHDKLGWVVWWLFSCGIRINYLLTWLMIMSAIVALLDFSSFWCLLFSTAEKAAGSHWARAISKLDGDEDSSRFAVHNENTYDDKSLVRRRPTFGRHSQTLHPAGVTRNSTNFLLERWKSICYSTPCAKLASLCCAHQRCFIKTQLLALVFWRWFVSAGVIFM